jgi:hypothetical protein
MATASDLRGRRIVALREYNFIAHPRLRVTSRILSASLEQEL